MLRFPLIAREGWVLLGAVAGLTGLFHAFLDSPVWILPGWLLLLFLLWHFRDPPRQIPLIPFAILSPVNGSVTQVEQIDISSLGKNILHIQVNMGYLDAMSIFSPVAGKPVSEQLLKELGSNREHAPQAGVSLKTDEGDTVRLIFTGKGWLSRFFCYAYIGQRLGQGQRCGFSYFACKVDIYLPEYARPHVKVGTQVKACCSCLADMQRKVGLHHNLQAA